MDSIKRVLREMIALSPEEEEGFLRDCFERTYRRREILCEAGQPADEIFFILEGLVRVVITDTEGTEHTVHFALEHQFIADYSGFLQKLPSVYRLQAVEATRAVVLPPSAIEWGYRHLRQGERLGRMVAEYYFIYNDNRIKALYTQSPKERYDAIDQIFPDIHNRVPQHMIASYLGISPVHLSRLKRASLRKT